MEMNDIWLHKLNTLCKDLYILFNRKESIVAHNMESYE